MANGPAAFYLAGSVDGSRPGIFYVNTFKFSSQPKYEMISLSMHESNPGHHFQSAFSLEKQDWPLFRKVMEDRIYSQSPSRCSPDYIIHTGCLKKKGDVSSRAILCP